MPDDDLSDALDYLAITRLQARYGDVITRRAWAELEPLFLPDAPITLDLRRGAPLELVGAEALGRMVERAVERFEFFEFALLNSVVDVVDAGAEHATATGRLYMWELRQEAASGRWTNAFGLYRDRYVRHEGRWVIAQRTYSSLARTGPDNEVFTIPPL
ncbi:MAG: nuclear transport factor 2 family protein [Acidimicrobiales bacterium]